MGFRDRFWTPTTAQGIVSWRLLLGAGGRRRRRPCSACRWSPPWSSASRLRRVGAARRPPRPREPADDRRVHRRRAVAALRPGRPTLEAPAHRDHPRPHQAGPLRDRLQDIADRLDDGLAEGWPSPSGATRSTPPSEALDPTRLRSRSTRCGRRRRPRRRRTSTPRCVRREPAGQRRPAEGALGQHRRQPPPDPGPSRRAGGPGHRGQRRGQRHGPLRPRRRRPRARAREPPPGRARAAGLT